MTSGGRISNMNPLVPSLPFPSPPKMKLLNLSDHPPPVGLITAALCSSPHQGANNEFSFGSSEKNPSSQAPLLPFTTPQMLMWLFSFSPTHLEEKTFFFFALNSTALILNLVICLQILIHTHFPGNKNETGG